MLHKSPFLSIYKVVINLCISKINITLRPSWVSWTWGPIKSAFLPPNLFKSHRIKQLLWWWWTEAEQGPPFSIIHHLSVLLLFLGHRDTPEHFSFTKISTHQLNFGSWFDSVHNTPTFYCTRYIYVDMYRVVLSRKLLLKYINYFIFLKIQRH